MVGEAGAAVRVEKLYQEIRNTLAIDFVPNLYKVMAAKPEYLEPNWNKVKAVMIQPGKLDGLTSAIIAVSISAVTGCHS